MKEELTLLRGVVIPRQEIQVEVSRSSGPGGQHVNRTESRVTLRFPLTASPSLPEEERLHLQERLSRRLTRAGEVLVSCGTHRDRTRNLDEAMQRLEKLLCKAMHRPKKRHKTRPTRTSIVRRLQSKRQRSERKRIRRPPNADD